MSQLEPPPSHVELVSEKPRPDSIWKQWLSKTYDWLLLTVKAHTDDTGWNAHGNTASTDGAAANPLKATSASLWFDNGTISGGTATGDYPTGAEYQGGDPESKLLWIGDKYAFRAGAVTGTEWDDANIGTASFAAGLGVKASAANTISIGNGSQATGLSSQSLGPGNIASNTFATCVGHDNTSSGIASYTIGAYTKASGLLNSFVIGAGTGVGGLLENTKSNSMIIGFGSTTGTFFLEQGKCGIEEDTPLSTLDVGGSVGYKYEIIDTTDSPYGLSDELVIICDNTAGNIVINLPATAGVDRRFYHIKKGYQGGSTGTVKIYAATGEYIDGALADSTTAGVTITGQDAPMILCDDTSTNKGWWFI